MTRPLAALILAAPLLFAASPVSAQAPPPTLTGEALIGNGPASTITSANCNPDGTSTFTYQTSGVATGPYNGTFTETGTVTIGPQPLPQPPVTSAEGGFVTAWTATFTIISSAPAATIKGTKHLLPPPPGFTADTTGICENGTRGLPGSLPFPPQHSATNYNSNQALGYSATITLTHGAQYRDTGTSHAIVDTGINSSANQFLENYASQQVTTIPLCDENSQGNQNQGGNDQGCANP